jgi:hypothetical protein
MTVETVQGGTVERAQTLARNARDLASQALRLAQGGRTLAALQVPLDETEPCDTGSVRISGTVDNVTFTGTLTIEYRDCRQGDQTINGTGSFRLDAFDVPNLLPTDFTISFPRLQLRGTGISRDVGGSVRSQLNIAAIKETLTQNLVGLDNLTGRMTKTENMVSDTVFDNVFSPHSFSTSISGRIYDGVHGYVDAVTAAPFQFGALSQRFPSNGQGTLTGANGRGIRVTATSATIATLGLDLDGDTVFERSATVAWLDLSKTSGADLADSDGDGMHDGWEDAHQLNKNGAADAALDPDSDGFTSLQEYLAGTDPNDAASYPLTGPGPGSGSDPTPMAFSGLEVSLAGVSDLAYDAAGQMLYASVRAGAGNPGSVVPINPATRTLGTAIPVGIEPTKLAISENGQYLYVGFDGQPSVQRINLANQAVDLTIALGNDPTPGGGLGPMYAEDIAVLPGSPQSIAVSLKNLCCSPRHMGVAVFDGVNRRTNMTPTHTGSNAIEFSATADTLYGYTNEQTSFGFFRMAVDASGVTVTDVQESLPNPPGALIEGFNVDIRFNAGRIYGTTGAVVDPVNRTILGTFILPGGVAAAVAPDTTSTAGRVYFLSNVSGWTIRAYSATSTQPAAAIMSFSTASGTASSLVRWGTNGLAFLTSTGQVFVINSAALVP